VLTDGAVRQFSGKEFQSLGAANIVTIVDTISQLIKKTCRCGAYTEPRLSDEAK